MYTSNDGSEPPLLGGSCWWTFHRHAQRAQIDSRAMFRAVLPPSVRGVSKLNLGVIFFIVRTSEAFSSTVAADVTSQTGSRFDPRHGSCRVRDRLVARLGIDSIASTKRSSILPDIRSIDDGTKLIQLSHVFHSLHTKTRSATKEDDEIRVFLGSSILTSTYSFGDPFRTR